MIYKDFVYETRIVKKRPWSWEVSLLAIREEIDHNIVMSFEKNPKEKDIEDMAIFWMEKILNEVEVEPEELISKKEVLKILKEKNIIAQSVTKFDEIKKKDKVDQIEAINLSERTV